MYIFARIYAQVQKQNDARKGHDSNSSNNYKINNNMPNPSKQTETAAAAAAAKITIRKEDSDKDNAEDAGRYMVQSRLIHTHRPERRIVKADRKCNSELITE